MRVWRAILLADVALAVGLAVGYGAWGRRVGTLEGELAAASGQAAQLRRENQACLAGGRVGEQVWEGRGIVRAVYARVVVISHEEIEGLLMARTTGFRWADAARRSAAHVGDPVRFWLQGTDLDTATLVKIEAW